MATALPLATAFTDASTTEAQLKTALTGERAALAEMGDPTARHGAIQNLSLVFSVGSNALTCNVKTRAGAVPSATDPVSAAMRGATSASGDFNVRNITGALSLVISSGSTLGHANATLGAIYWYLIDNAGTLELAASTSFWGPKGIVTTVAEGGAGAADSERVMYSTTARSNVPFICVARTFDLQTTAGTWTAVPLSVGQAPIAEYATFNVFSRSSNTMLDILDWGKTIIATSSFTQTLDAVTTLGDGWWVRYRNDGTGVITLDPNSSETIDGATTLALYPGDSATIVCNGSSFKTVGLYQGVATLGTEQATTSGTSIDFTAIPSWVQRITIQLVGVSTSGTSPVMVQIGDSGGIENTSYSGVAFQIGNAGSAVTLSSTSGFLITPATAATNIFHGAITLTLEDAAQFTWVATGTLADSGVDRFFSCAGSKSLSAALDRVRLTTLGGTDTFDAGAVNILYD